MSVRKIYSFHNPNAKSVHNLISRITRKSLVVLFARQAKHFYLLMASARCRSSFFFFGWNYLEIIECFL